MRFCFKPVIGTVVGFEETILKDGSAMIILYAKVGVRFMDRVLVLENPIDPLLGDIQEMMPWNGVVIMNDLSSNGVKIAS